MKKIMFTATVDSHILNFHLPFLKYFKENKYEVHVATNGYEKIPYCKFKHVVSFARNPFKFSNIKAVFQLKKIIKNNKYEIIHTNTPMGSVVTRLAAIGSNARVIYTAHGFHFYKGAPLINWVIFFPVEWILSFCTDTLITINMEDYNLAKKYFHTCVKYVPGIGLNEEKFDFKMSKKEKNLFRASLKLNDDDFVMIYVAELNKNKNQGWLIKTLCNFLKNNKNVHILLPGKDSINRKYEKLVDRLELNKQIHFLGFRKDISKLLNISDLSISVSKREGLPVNIMEAMSAGLPIVALDTRGVRDLIINDKNGFIIKNNDKEKFIYKINSIYYQKELLTKKFKKTNKSLIKNYSLEKIMKLMIEIYNI